MASPARLRSIYRSLLRELPPRPILASPRAPVHQHLRDNFTLSSSSSSSSPSAPDADATEQYVAYLRAQRAYTGLLERYNPGMGMDEEERVRLSARRVGVNLPKEYLQEKEGCKHCGFPTKLKMLEHLSCAALALMGSREKILPI